MTDTDGRGASKFASSTSGQRRVLAVASSGGHFKQLVRIVHRLPDVSEVCWVTYGTGQAEHLLASAGRSRERLVFVPYAAPRDVVNLSRNAAAVRRILRDDTYDIAISTGAGIAVAALPVARLFRARAVFVESATRVNEPSLSGRLLERVPGIELCSQQLSAPTFGRRWRHVGSVYDDFAPGPQRADAALQRVVVTLGTIQPYGFRRLLERLIEILPSDCEVLWQTGATDVTGLPLGARAMVPGPEFERAIDEADVVIAHAGTGTALTAFERGRCPVLVPRRQAYGEHVDDHQVGTARALAARGLAIHAEVEELDLQLLRKATGRSVVDNPASHPLDL